MIPNALLPVANHLWQSTLFAGIAGLLTLSLRQNRAHTRYCLWLAASAKFFVPFSFFLALGGQIGRQTDITPAHSSVPMIIGQMNEPFTQEASPPRAAAQHPPKTATSILPLIALMWA